MKTAIVVGATGLVGTQLVDLLLNDSRIEKVKVFVRRDIGVAHPKLEVHIVNFDEPDGWKKQLTGNVLFSAMGTTMATAGSKEAQYKVDYTYQYYVAKAAAANGVSMYVLVSAAASSAESRIFYSRIKGELERDVKKLPFETIHIIRPGMLAGDRKESRPAERIGIGAMNLLSMIPGFARLKPIQGRAVAHAMVNAAFRHIVGIHSYTMREVSRLAERVK